MKEIEYEGHARTLCLTNADARHWRWRKLQPSVFTFTDGSHPGAGGCDCIRYISSCKLPLGNGLGRYRDPFGAESESDATVIVATNPKDLYLLPLRLDRLYRHENPHLSKSIFIWSFNHPYSTLLAGPPWDLFLQRLFGAAKLATCPNDIILVNYEAVASRHISIEDRKDMTLLQVANDTVQKAYLAHLNTIHPVSYPGIKTVEQARQVKFTFVSMTTYLAEYDWKGELTEEQVRPWSGEKT